MRRRTLPFLLARMAAVFTFNPVLLRIRAGAIPPGGQVPLAVLLAAGGLTALLLRGVMG